MLTPQDDLIGHQLSTSFAHTANSDPAWMERLYFAAMDIGGDVIFSTGIGYHPNRNVMDGYVGVTIGAKQHNLRLSRHLGHDPLNVEIGPLRIRVVEGMKRHRITLAPNDLGLTCDLTFQSHLHPHEEDHRFVRRRNRVIEDLVRYQQAGRWSGWIEMEGRRYTVEPDRWWGQRDHSWGIRPALRTDETSPPLTPFPPLLFGWAIAQFEDRAIHLYVMDRGPGDPVYVSGEEVLPQSGKADPRRKVKVVTHDIEWDGDALGQQFRTARFDLVLADGSRRELVFRKAGTRFFLKGGLYGGLDGWDHGDDKGRYYAQSNVWDLEDAADRNVARALSDEICACSEGGENGYGTFQYWVTRDYPVYADAWKFPAP
ncbi:MAG: hypothetical protein AB7E60_03905 [Sphingobium sp.]